MTTPSLISALFFAVRMRLPRALVLDEKRFLRDCLEDEWDRCVWGDLALETEIKYARAFQHRCSDCLVEVEALFKTDIRSVIRNAPRDVKRHCRDVYAILRLRLFPGQRDVCWLIMEHVFMDGSSLEAGLAVINSHPGRVMDIVRQYPTSVTCRWDRQWNKARYQR